MKNKKYKQLLFKFTIDEYEKLWIEKIKNKDDFVKMLSLFSDIEKSFISLKDKKIFLNWNLFEKLYIKEFEDNQKFYCKYIDTYWIDMYWINIDLNEFGQIR